MDIYGKSSCTINWTVAHCFVIYLTSKLNFYIYLSPPVLHRKNKGNDISFSFKLLVYRFWIRHFSFRRSKCIFFPKIHEKLQSIFPLFWEHTDDGTLCLFWWNPGDCFPDVLETWPIGEETKQRFISIMCKTLPIIFSYNPHQ